MVKLIVTDVDDTVVPEGGSTLNPEYYEVIRECRCSNHRNNDTISIECCHADDTGQFSPATLDALIQLLNWLISTYELGQDGILRYYERVSILFC